MRNVLYGLDKDGFPQLKYLQVRDNDNLSCIVDSMDANRNAFPVLESLLIKNLINLEKICQGPLTAESAFSQLRKINVEQCDKLENMFSLSIAGRLKQLQSLDVFGCKNMNEIFTIEREDESNSEISEVIDNIELSQLYSPRLWSFPQLKSLAYNGNESETFFRGKVALPNLEFLEFDKIWQKQAAAVSSGIQNLTSLILSGCNNLKFLFSSSMIRSFHRLQYLEISKCQVLEEIIVTDDDRLREEERKNNVAIPIFNIYWHMRVEQCDKLKILFPRDTYESFIRLQSLHIRDCSSLEVIFDAEDTNFEEKHGVVVTQLSEVVVDGLPKF